ncbi:RNA polymerase II accessory factor, Cdc73 [Cordyceps militaris CM01]|uniref:RNA polymerase II accessory factor, Cdc73 n=1 Tax=Cordyceps militaris (strain CM01) TaxID=983644 RepID=G3J6H7_CORMM|nr:RNA polymerase II accessory factor, Cdc73 [Cordyceps militaris CM01]EGX96211.1 RNA polymerase II accessory factor, Cdc73 [Cordyceps militaris CM01]
MTSSVLHRPWSPHASTSGEPNLPMQALSSASPFLFMNVVTPSPAGIDKSYNIPKWKPFGACALLEVARAFRQVDERAGYKRCFIRLANVLSVYREAGPSPSFVKSVHYHVVPAARGDRRQVLQLLHQGRLRTTFKSGLANLAKKNSLHEEVYEDALPLPVDKNAHHGKVIPGLGKTGTWLREEFGSGKRTKKIFGRAPWNRKDSTATFSSVSSSIREVLRGYTPPASPHLAANNAAYFNNKWMTNTFPGGEAMRVSTPPMDEDTADGRPRGFFGPLTPPEPGTADSQTYMTPMTSFASPKYNAHRMSMAVPSREWWEAKPQKSPRHDDPSKVARFEFDIPEHLPNSPMCPANLRHKHGGTGLCVYHGRRRALSTVSDEGPKRRDSKSTC